VINKKIHGLHFSSNLIATKYDNYYILLKKGTNCIWIISLLFTFKYLQSYVRCVFNTWSGHSGIDYRLHCL